MKLLSKHKRDLLFLIISLMMALLYFSTAGRGFPLDDSWIHQVYARNLAESGQWAFVPGQPSAASTSPLYTVVLAVGYLLGIDYMVWAHLVGALALTGSGMIGARMARMIMPEHRMLPLCTGLALILAWHLVWAAVSGMETMIFSALTLLIPYLAWRDVSTDEHSTRAIILRGTVFGICSALITLARPEGLGLAGITGLVMLVTMPPRRLIYWIMGTIVGFTVFISPYLLLNWQLTGGLLPSTAAAKQMQNAGVVAQLTYLERVWLMTNPLIAGVQLFLLPGAVFFTIMMLQRANIRRQLLYLVPVIWPIALVALYAARLPAPFQHGRYVIPALPAFIVAGVIGTAAIVKWGHISPVKRVFSRVLALSTCLVLLGFAFWLGPGVFATDVHIIEEEMVASAHWIAENLSPEELLVIHDIGAVGYFAPRPILDIAGLVNPEVIPIINDGDALWELMLQHNGRYLMAFPDQIPNDNVNDPRLCQVFITNGETSRRQGGPNMAVYRLSWESSC